MEINEKNLKPHHFQEEEKEVIKENGSLVMTNKTEEISNEEAPLTREEKEALENVVERVKQEDKKFLARVKEAIVNSKIWRFGKTGVKTLEAVIDMGRMESSNDNVPFVSFVTNLYCAIPKGVSAGLESLVRFLFDRAKTTKKILGKLDGVKGESGVEVQLKIKPSIIDAFKELGSNLACIGKDVFITPFKLAKNADKVTEENRLITLNNIKEMWKEYKDPTYKAQITDLKYMRITDISEYDKKYKADQWRQLEKAAEREYLAIMFEERPEYFMDSTSFAKAQEIQEFFNKSVDEKWSIVLKEKMKMYVDEFEQQGNKEQLAVLNA